MRREACGVRRQPLAWSSAGAMGWRGAWGDRQARGRREEQPLTCSSGGSGIPLRRWSLIRASSLLMTVTLLPHCVCRGWKFGLDFT